MPCRRSLQVGKVVERVAATFAVCRNSPAALLKQIGSRFMTTVSSARQASDSASALQPAGRPPAVPAEATA